MQMQKAANRHLLLPVSSLRLSQAAGGVISVDYYTVSDVVIKPNQETQTRELNREQKEEKMNLKRKGRNMVKMQQSTLERREENEDSVCLRRKKSNFEKFIEAGFYDKWSCVGLDGQRSKGAICRGGRQRLCKACQPSSFLSHSYLVCLDRHNIKGEQRKRQHWHNWHVERTALHYSGQ